ncbi:uncharacterized protein EI97DRAFT_469702 [Westerdykella ornata]|uniref:Dedicator of cytokinesis protein 1 n=1 Tax=Westerdykella ornata TaxID=318751 RepID=A0A6A6JAF6_WESOR|nr:uncharacterized protein EI97DRAFT_469702 [Westerdykella ornata]KAF2273305.1 hypothetical protein EI97DRAFT_469702 [Westerdykella ornata]
MSSWRPLPQVAYAVCTYPFQPSAREDLPLEIGDELYIIEQGGKDGAWYRGYLLAAPSLLAGLTSAKGQPLEARVFSGIFPRVCVRVLEFLFEGRHTPALPDTPERSPGSHQALGGPISNGVITPTGSTSTTPPFAPARGTASHTRGSSRSDRGSQFTARSEHPQQLALPLSPESVTSRDPNAPRPPAPVPMLKIGDETPTSYQEPLVDEIASCLREWHSTKVHELILSRKYAHLDKMETLVRKLDTTRRQLLNKQLTAKELDKVREGTVWDLVAGNKVFCEEVIVRSPSQRGRILTSDDSAIEVTKLQSIMSLLDARPTPHVDEHILHHLYVSIKHVLGDLTQGSPQLSMHLCLKEPGEKAKPLSEVYSFDLTGKDGTPLHVSGDKLRSLFVDLSSSDIGEGASSGSCLYLVFKLLVNEPLHVEPANPESANSSREKVPTTSTLQSSQVGSVKGRRSAMFGGKRKDSPSSASTENRATSVDVDRTQSQDGRPDSSAAKAKPSSPRDQKVMKRAVAMGALRVDPLMRALSESDQNVTMWTPADALDEAPEDGQGWDDILPELFPSPNGLYRNHASIHRIILHLKAFSNADSDSLIEKTPTLLQNIKLTRKIGFSGAPTKPRSDIYVTLVEPSLPKNACLSHPKTGTVPLAPASSMLNLQLTLEVRKASGDRIEGCIYPSSNSVGHTAWRTTAIKRGEQWNATIRLAIPPEDVPGSHIVMSIADAPGFPFALGWMPLWNQDAFVRDGEHSLSLYRYDEYTSSMIAGKGAYLGLPWEARRKDELVMGTLATLNLRTYLCSTEYSQDPTLLGVLRWRDQAAGDLIGLLKRFPFVAEIELVKLLNEVFDALFEILVEYAGSDEYEDLVFNALVVVLGIVHDRRFKLSPLVDQYVQTKFNYPFATACLVRSYIRLLANPTDPESSRRLRATFKVGRQILKFIMSARQQQKEKEAGIGITTRQQTFARDIRSIFQALEALMENPSPVLIGTKTILVQQFHTWLPELSPSIHPTDILKLTCSFVESCSTAKGKLILYKILLIRHLFHMDVFNLPDIRRILLMNTVRWLAPHWGKVDSVDDQWKDQVRLCCSVVASQVDELGEHACAYMPKLVHSYRALQGEREKERERERGRGKEGDREGDTTQPAKKTLSLLFPTTYPFPSRPTTTEARIDEAMVEISAVLAALSTSPTIIHPDLPQSDIAPFLSTALQVFTSILDCEAFPKSWLSVHIYQHKSTIKVLEKIASVMIDSFLPSDPEDVDNFDTGLWRSFFDVLLKLVGSDALALETFPEQKRRAVWKIAGDVRQMGAELLQRSWEAIGWETTADEKKQYGLDKLGGFQVQYVPGLVAPIVHLCLSVHEGLRSVATGILQTMIISEWTLNAGLELIQAEMIDCLDGMFKSKHLTEAVLQKHFIQELLDRFEPVSQDADDALFVAVKDLIATIDEQMDLLVAVHSTEAVGEVFHIMDTLHLMEFLKDMQKEDIYIRYVHQLVDLQKEAQNYTEAGLALRLHAELYDWEPSTMLEPLADPDFPEQSAFERKEQLYFRMIEYYEKGQSWDNALGTYMELATQYQSNVFDFPKLARTQHAMAYVYEKIAKGERANPRYFRVVYKGLGFPAGLRDKQFIFEGSPNDRLSTFIDRMQQQHPTAQILNTGAEDILEGQFLLIFPVSPQKDFTHPVYQRAKVAQSVRDFHLLSRPTHFATTSRINRTGTDGQQHIVVEKTVYTTAEAFPTILRRSEIISVVTVTPSPLQNAIDRTCRKTAELAALEKQVQNGEDAAMTTLIKDLTVAVDTRHEACVANYHSLLTEQDDSDFVDGETLPVEPDPLENALKVALIDYALVVRRCLTNLLNRPAQKATQADLTQRFDSAYQRELTVLAPANPTPLRVSPLGSLRGGSTNSPLRQFGGSPVSPASQGDGSRVRSPTLNGWTARQEKKRLSIGLALVRSAFTDGPTEHKAENSIDNQQSNGFAAVAPSRDHEEDTSKAAKRLSQHFGEPSAHLTPVRSGRRSESVDRRPNTSKSIKSVKSEKSDNPRKNSVRKRFSMLNIGKKSSKNSVKAAETLTEE